MRGAICPLVSFLQTLITLGCPCGVHEPCDDPAWSCQLSGRCDPLEPLGIGKAMTAVQRLRAINVRLWVAAVGQEQSVVKARFPIRQGVTREPKA